MTFQSQKSPQTQTDMVLPLTAAATLRSFNQTLLFDAAMKVFNLPTVVGIFDALQIGYLNLRTRPMLRRAVRGNVAKHSDQSVTFEPDHAPELGNLDFKFCTEAYQLSKQTIFGAKPLLCASISISEKWSFLVLPFVSLSKIR
jgi:hypothetical protein